MKQAMRQSRAEGKETSEQRSSSETDDDEKKPAARENGSSKSDASSTMDKTSSSDSNVSKTCGPMMSSFPHPSTPLEPATDQNVGGPVQVQIEICLYCESWDCTFHNGECIDGKQAEDEDQPEDDQPEDDEVVDESTLNVEQGHNAGQTNELTLPCFQYAHHPANTLCSRTTWRTSLLKMIRKHTTLMRRVLSHFHVLLQ
jgi:hypothetical protein